MNIIHLSDRAIIRLNGEEVKPFLQNLVSNDVNAVSAENAVLAALLSPQGKFLFDFFMVADGEDILLDTEADHADALVKRLTMYKLRSKISIAREDSHVYAALDGDVPEDVLTCLLYTSPSPRDQRGSRMPSSA